MAGEVIGMTPADTVWWNAHQAQAPAVVLRCAECKTTQVGEVKVDGDVVYLGARTRVPETWVPNPPIAAPNADVLRREIELRNSRTLRVSDDGSHRLLRRADFGTTVFRLSGSSHDPLRLVRCSVHGEREIPDAADLCATALDAANRGVKRSVTV